MAHQIGLLNEKALHASLKETYAQEGDQVEVPLDGVVVDIIRGPLLVEIQTRNFSSIKNKITDLAARHPIRLVYPIAVEKWIAKLAPDTGTITSRRRSPKKGKLADLFVELVSFPELMNAENFTLEVLLIQEEEIRRHDDSRAWRRKGWVTHERRLLEIVDRQLFATPADLGALVPITMVDPFTTADLAQALGRPRNLAQKMAYCLRALGVITPVGKRSRSWLYSRTV